MDIVKVKLACLASHAEEALGSGGHHFDLVAVRALLDDPDVKAYMLELRLQALLPVARASAGEQTA